MLFLKCFLSSVSLVLGYHAGGGTDFDAKAEWRNSASEKHLSDIEVGRSMRCNVEKI